MRGNAVVNQALSLDLRDASNNEATRNEVSKAVLDILLETGSYTGDCFFQSFTDTIAGYFSVDGVYLSELDLNDEASRPVAFHRSREEMPGPDVLRTAGLLSQVMERGEIVMAAHPGKQLATNDQLRSLKAQTLLGTILRSQSHDAIGALLLLHSTPLPRVGLIQAVLQQIGPRIAAELERRQRETALRNSEARLRLLTDGSKDVLFYVQTAPNIEVQYISPSVESVFGLPVEAFQARPELLFELPDASDRAHLQSAIESGSEEPLVGRINMPAGGSHWVEYHDFAVQNQGRIVGVGGAVRDVTRRVEAERALQGRERYMHSLLDSVPDTLILVQLDGVVLDFLPGEVNTGLGSLEQVSGHNLKELMPAPMVTALERMMRTSSRTNRQQTLQFHVPGQNPRFYEMRCMPFEERNLLLVMRDLTPQNWQSGEAGTQATPDQIDEHIESRSRSNAYSLTYRELAVLGLIVEGMSDKQIADDLGISIYTVNKHVGNVLGKMNAASRTEAGVRAVREGFLPRK